MFKINRNNQNIHITDQGLKNMLRTKRNNYFEEMADTKNDNYVYVFLIADPEKLEYTTVRIK